MDHVDLMSDAELRINLLKHGYTVPVTASNRNVLKKKLRQLLTDNTNRPLRYTVEKDPVEPIKRQSLVRNEIDFKTSCQVSVMSDAELRARLLEHGYNVPVTQSNLIFLKEKLEHLMTNNQPRFKPKPFEPLVPVKPVEPTRPFVRHLSGNITASQVPFLTNVELRDILHQYGYRNMPVTTTTRTVLEKKLMSLLSNVPVDNRQNTDTWFSPRSSMSSDYVDPNRTNSSPRVSKMPIDLRHGPSNVSQIPTHDNLNKPSTSTGIGIQSSNTSNHLNYIQSPFDVSSSLDNNDVTTRTGSLYSSPKLSVDTSSTTTNNAEKRLISKPLVSSTSRPSMDVSSSSSEKTNSTNSLPAFNNMSNDTISVPIMKDVEEHKNHGQSMKNFATTFAPKTSPFIIDFMNRLSALTEEPPKALSFNERKRNILTPLQQQVLHRSCKIMCANQSHDIQWTKKVISTGMDLNMDYEC